MPMMASQILRFVDFTKTLRFIAKNSFSGEVPFNTLVRRRPSYVLFAFHV